MKNLRKIILLSCFLGLLAGLAACGRYSEPYPVPDSGFPHNYPQK